MHQVIPQVDRGQVVLKRVLPFLPNDTLTDVESRIHALEHELIVEAVKLLVEAMQNENKIE